MTHVCEWFKSGSCVECGGPYTAPDPPAGGTTEFGFDWGPASVTRCCLLPNDRRVIQVKTPHKTLDIYVSATGRSVRVFSDHKELKGC